MPPAAPTATNSGQAQQNLQAYTGGMQSPDQAIQAANAQYGTQAKQQTANELQTSLQNTNQVLNQVAPGVMGRTANSLVTSAQANRQIQNESAPIQTQLNNLGQQYQTADKSYTDALSQAENQANANLGFQSQHQSYLQGVYNDLYTQEQNAAQLAAEKYAADASANATRAASTSPQLVTTNGSQNGSGLQGSLSRNSVGGYAVTDAKGQPITLGQYADLNGGGVQDVIGLLQQGSPQDKQLAQKISTGIQQGMYNPQSLAQQFPQIFGG